MGRKIKAAAAALGIWGAILSGAAAAIAQAQNGEVAASPPADVAPEVPAAKPGVFNVLKKSANRFHLQLKGHVFTSRDDIEKYLAYRAGELTMEQHDSWFTLIENRNKGDSAPVPKPDPSGLRYSFRLSYWRPVWRYRLSGSKDWKTWSPFSSVAFFANDMDPKTIGDFEVDADIVLHKATMNDADPLAFDASALCDLLVNQVSPPQ
jgi:hypothetical protein